MDVDTLAFVCLSVCLSIGRVSLCNPSWLGIYCVDQVGLEL